MSRAPRKRTTRPASAATRSRTGPGSARPAIRSPHRKVSDIHVYSDASFSRVNRLGVTGVLLFDSDEAHLSVGTHPAIQTSVFTEDSNIRAELRGVISALETAIGELARTEEDADSQLRRITLYTDCQPIARLLERRERLETTDFSSKKKGTPLSNADLYRQFFCVYDKVTPKLVWVRGHTPARDRNLIQTHFSRLDKTVRRVLRSARASGSVHSI